MSCTSPSEDINPEVQAFLNVLLGLSTMSDHAIILSGFDTRELTPLQEIPVGIEASWDVIESTNRSCEPIRLNRRSVS